MEKYSVLMSVYEKESPEFFRTSIESMLNQTIPPEEFVIVEDGPLTDGLRAVIEEYRSRYPEIFTIVPSKKNNSLGAALTLGLKHTRNELVARMDSDDISLPERCETELRLFEEFPELDIVGAYDRDFLGGPENLLGMRVVPLTQEASYKRGKTRSPFNHVTVMFRKSTVMKFGGYADIPRCEDADLFGRMMFGGCRAKNIEQVLVYVRVSPERMRRRKSWQHVKNIISVRRKFWKMGYASFFDFLIFLIAQLVVFASPIWLQNIIYSKFLRK